MIEFLTKFLDESEKLAKAASQAAVRSLRKASYAIFKDAQGSIKTDPEPSLPGEPPHSRHGQLPRAIRYDVDAENEVAVIGPRFSVVGESAEAEEFGGEYKGDQYPLRPFMGPALQRNLSLIPGFFSGSVEN